VIMSSPDLKKIKSLKTPPEATSGDNDSQVIPSSNLEDGSAQLESKEDNSFSPSLIDYGVNVIDSHLHVWSDGQSPFEYWPQQEPPEAMRSNCGADDLMEKMDAAGVAGCLIVQPINHKYDHSYVESVIKAYPQKLKGMCLANPTLSAEESVRDIENLYQKGFVGIRFNPYLWPADQRMCNDVGQSLFAKAGELGMPVGVMCFKGLDLHFDDIQELLKSNPNTKVIIDHFGFFKQGSNTLEDDDRIFSQLLSLAKYPQVHVKVSAYFRLSRESYPYADLQPRLAQLLSEYGSSRLLWGSDYPFVKNECGYSEAVQALFSWGELNLSQPDIKNIFEDTALSLFNKWA